MKKWFLLFCLISLRVLGQTEEKSACALKWYGSTGVSIGHVDPADPSIDHVSKAWYPSVEFGIMGENLSLGTVFGAENFFASSQTRGFYELKTSVFKTCGKITPYAIFGSGAFFENGFNPFIEYGAGFSYMPEKLGYFVQFSNWSRTNYVSVGLSFCFN